MSGSSGRERKRDRTPKENGWTGKVLELVRAEVIGLLVACFVLILSAVLVYTGTISNTKADSLIVASCLIGGFISGILTVKNGTYPGILLGLMAGGILFLLLLSLGAIFYDPQPDMDSLWFVGGACFCGGGLSGFFRGKKTKPRRR